MNAASAAYGPRGVAGPTPCRLPGSARPAPDDHRGHTHAASRDPRFRPPAGIPGLEVLVARGSAPSVQRNAAIRVASGDLIYFLDPDNLNLITETMSGDERIVGVGGPSLPPENPGPWQRLKGALFAHPLGAFGYRLRYMTSGPSGPTGGRGRHPLHPSIRPPCCRRFGRAPLPQRGEPPHRSPAEGGIFMRDPLSATASAGCATGAPRRARPGRRGPHDSVPEGRPRYSGRSSPTAGWPSNAPTRSGRTWPEASPRCAPVPCEGARLRGILVGSNELRQNRRHAPGA
jgi:hypothetical protein